MGKVQFGLSDVHYAPLDTEKRTYGTVTAIPGAVNLTVDTAGDQNTFYADNGAFAVFATNSGYTGELEIAMIPDSVYTDILGFIKDNADEFVEVGASKETHFGLSFRIETNYGQSIAFRFFNCTMSRPSLEHSTTSDSTDPTTEKLSLTMLPFDLEDGTTVIKSHKVLSTTEAHAYCSAITLPVLETA